MASFHNVKIDPADLINGDNVKVKLLLFFTIYF